MATTTVSSPRVSGGLRPGFARAEPLRRRRATVIARWAVGGIVLALLGLEATVVAPYVGRAAHALASPELGWLAVAVAAELWSLVAFARLQRRMLAAGGTTVSVCSMVNVSYAATALSVTLPAGTALSAGYTFRRLRGYGASAPAAGFTLLASGVLSTVSFALLALTGGVLLGLGHLNPAVLVVEVIAAAAVLVAARKLTADSTRLQHSVDRVLGWVNRALRRPREAGTAAAHEFLSGLGRISPRSRDWAIGLAMAAANWLADLACLVASSRAVGVHLSVGLVVVTFLAGATASSLSFLPGGLGMVDGAMILALTQGGLQLAPGTAAVVLYRLISFVLIITLGWLAWWVTWRRERREFARSFRPAAILERTEA